MVSNIELLFREGMEKKINNIKELTPDVKFYSISRINNYNTCPKQYYLTYIDRHEQKPGVYGNLGSAVHNDLEDLYTKKTSELENNNFQNEWIKCKLFNVTFPSESIENKYKKDIDTFYKMYTKIPGKHFISELGFILKLDELHYIYGYIDLVEIINDTTVKIIDFKTSSMFNKKKLIEAGRQLCIYQIALEKLYGLTTISNGWQMLKYLDVKIGSAKSKIISANELLSKIEKPVSTLCKKYKIEDLKIQYYLQLINKGQLEKLPEYIKNDIQIKTCFVPCEVTEDTKRETLKYIMDTIKIIEEHDNKEIWCSKPNYFFCKNLCGFYPKHCKGQ